MTKILLKFIGLLLVVLGIVIIFASLFLTYQIFWLKKPAPQIFQSTSLEKTQEKKSIPKNLDPQELMRLQSQEAIKELFREVLPQERVNQLLNLIAFSIFVFILVMISGQMIASGLKLMNAFSKNE